MLRYDIDQPPKAARKKSGIAVRIGSISEFFSISAFREVREISINVIILINAYCLMDCAYIMVPSITFFMPLNE